MNVWPPITTGALTRTAGCTTVTLPVGRVARVCRRCRSTVEADRDRAGHERVPDGRGEAEAVGVAGDQLGRVRHVERAVVGDADGGDREAGRADRPAFDRDEGDADVEAAGLAQSERAVGGRALDPRLRLLDGEGPELRCGRRVAGAVAPARELDRGRADGQAGGEAGEGERVADVRDVACGVVGDALPERQLAGRESPPRRSPARRPA